MVLLVLAIICFHNLADAPIYDYDEARHAANAYEMMRDGNLLVNTWGGEADYWNLKPPLSMWLIMVGYAVFGFTPWGVRVPSVVCYILTIVIIVLTARKTWGRGAGLSCCVLALALTKPLEGHWARTGDPDALYLLLFTGAVFLFALSANRRWLVYPAGVLTGLAFLTKSWHAALIPVSVFIYLFVAGQWHRYRVRDALGYLACTLLVAGAWALARFSYDGDSFLVKMFTNDVVRRGTSNLEGHGAPVSLYTSTISSDKGARAALLLAAGALWYFVTSRIAAGERRPRVVLRHALAYVRSGGDGSNIVVMAIVVSLATFAVFGVSVSKLSWYIMPIWPCLLLLGGFGGSRLAASLMEREGVWQVALASLLLLYAAVPGIQGFEMNLNVVRTPKQTAEARKQQAIATACEDGTVEKGSAVYYAEYNSKTGEETTRINQGAYVVGEWKGDLRLADGGVKSYLSDKGDAALLVSDADAERHTELSGLSYSSYDGFRVYAKRVQP